MSDYWKHFFNLPSVNKTTNQEDWENRDLYEERRIERYKTDTLALVMRRSRQQVREDIEKKKWASLRGNQVYFIYDPERHLIKIGFSSQLKKRFRTLQLDYPEIILWGAIRGGRDLEAVIHKMFTSFNLPVPNKDGSRATEWFLVEKPIMFFIKHFSSYSNPNTDDVKRAVLT